MIRALAAMALLLPAAPALADGHGGGYGHAPRHPPPAVHHRPAHPTYVLVPQRDRAVVPAPFRGPAKCGIGTNRTRVPSGTDCYAKGAAPGVIVYDPNVGPLGYRAGH